MVPGPLHKMVQQLRRMVGRVADASDRDLLNRYATARDQAAFTALVQRHGPLVLGVCRRLLVNEQDAEDAFQAAFLLLAKKVDAVRWCESIGNWLYEAAFRIASKLRVQSARRLKYESKAPSPRPADSSTAVDWRDLRGVIDEELNRLPEKFRLPLLLCYLHGKTRDEAAEELGWSVATVKGRLERGRDVLRQRLTRRGLSLSAALLPLLLGQEGVAAVPAALATASVQGATTSVVAAPVAALVKGAMQAMFWTKLKKAAVVLAVVALASGAGAFAFRGADDPKGAPETRTEPPAKEPEPAWGEVSNGLRLGLSPRQVVVPADAEDLTLTVWYENVGKEEREIPVHVVPNLDHLVFKGVKNGKSFDVCQALERSATPAPQYARLAAGKKQHDHFTLRFGGMVDGWLGLPALAPGESLTLRVSDLPGRKGEPILSGTITVTRAAPAK